LGIKVSREHLLALLPEEPRKREESLRQTKSPERELLAPKDWLAKIRKEHPQWQNESHIDYTRRLHNFMEVAPVTRQWTEKTLYRRLYDK
jgi:hypothetical protein